MECEDIHIWAYTRNGCKKWDLSYLAAIAYDYTSVNTQEANKLKARFWDLKTLPKIIMFCWRAISGALGVADCLNGHGLQMPIAFKVCNSGSETMCHVLFDCVSAKALWSICNLMLPLAGFSLNQHENFRYLFYLMLDVRVDKVWCDVPWILWGICITIWFSVWIS